MVAADSTTLLLLCEASCCTHLASKELLWLRGSPCVFHAALSC